MKTKSKALLLTLCAVLLVAASVLGTFAYLTYQETVTNTFTVGKVTFGDPDPDDPSKPKEKGLDEALVNEKGQPIKSETDSTVVALPEAPRVLENTYKLLPGHDYIKDPTVHVNVESEACYIFIKVENGIADIEADTEKDENDERVENGYVCIADQILDNKWTKLEGVTDENGETVDNVYYKLWTTDSTDNNTNDSNLNTDDLIVFSNFQIKTSVDGDTLANYANAKIIVTAYGIQADGFKDEVEAWKAGIGEGGWNKTSEGNG